MSPPPPPPSSRLPFTREPVPGRRVTQCLLTCACGGAERIWVKAFQWMRFRSDRKGRTTWSVTRGTAARRGWLQSSGGPASSPEVKTFHWPKNCSLSIGYRKVGVNMACAQIVGPESFGCQTIFSLSIISQIIGVQPTGPKLLVHNHLVTSCWFRKYSPTW